jgi:23S rRNA (cytosine1962-C5)-methyltransferase
MGKFASVILKPGKEAAILRRHPWVFSGAIGKIMGNIGEGDVVEVFSSDGKYLASGHFLMGSIAVKLFSFTQTAADYQFWLERLQRAFELRRKLGLTQSPLTNAYRLVFSEGDELPGLIIDWYNGVAVIQTHSLGMHNIKPLLVNVLKEIFGDKLIAIYDKSSETMARSSPLSHSSTQSLNHSVPRSVTQSISHSSAQSLSHFDHLSHKDTFLYNTALVAEIAETGHKFRVDFISGQKTGFFLDQRSNRMFAQFYAKNRNVLNTFCYSGAFSVYCMKGGARLVHSVDSSRQAVLWTKENLELNGLDETRHRSDVADVKLFLKNITEKYDMIIVDPPAFAKTHQVTNNALHAYIHLNTAAIRNLNPGGLLFTFSCSQAISREMFRSAVQSAAIESGRNIRILHHLSQGPDHPVSIYHPEGEYLKGLILEVE